MTLVKRVEGVFLNPRPTFEAVVEGSVWWDILIVLLIALIAYSLVIAPYAKHDQAQVIRESVKLKDKMGEEQFNKYVQGLEGPATTWQIIQTFVGAPAFFVIALLLQALLLLMLCRLVSSVGLFSELFASLVHASAINVLLGNAVRLVLVLTRKSAMQTSTSLAMFFPKMEVT